MTESVSERSFGDAIVRAFAGLCFASDRAQDRLFERLLQRTRSA